MTFLEAQKFFTDETYSELKGTVTSESLKEIKTAVIYQLAKELLEGNTIKNFVLVPTILARVLK